MAGNGKAIDPARWQKLLDDMAPASGDVYFLKEKTTRLRLVLPEGFNLDENPEFWADTEAHYKGKVTTKHLIYAVVLSTSKSEDTNVDKTKVRAVRVPKSILRSILGNLAEGWELFDYKVGHGLVITKSGGGDADRTSYEVKTSPKPVPTADGLIWPEKSLKELADEASERSRTRSLKGDSAPAKSSDGAEEEDAPF